VSIPHQAGPAWRLAAECPRCRRALVVRYARRDGGQFIGCTGYPHCRFTCEYNDALQWLASRTAALETEVRAGRRAQGSVRLLAPASLERALTHLISLAHPDRWSQRQPATTLAHELTTALRALREQIQRGS
jgi:ssDNA-binding Zn-finger/Zn-ribbon topoisomerase 1